MNPTIAYIASEFPLISETFVYREVRALRDRGWIVSAASLNEPTLNGAAGFDDLRRDLVVVYKRPRVALLAAAAKETLVRPFCSMKTLGQAVMDAIAPGEPIGLLSRAKLIAQAVASLALARRLRRQRVQHIHCHFAHAPTTLGMYAAMQLGIGFSFTGHANDLFQRRCLLKRKLQRAAFVSSISHWHGQLYASVYPQGRPKCRLIRCGVDTGAWQPPSPATSTDRRLHVLTVCRLVEKKGVDTLICGLREFQQRYQRPWKLTIAGDGPERDRLVALAEQLRCQDSICWIGSVDNARVRELMAAADVFVLPCRADRSGDRDGIPVALMEAMASGLPVISGDLPAIRELVENRVTGILIEGDDAAALADRLYELDADASERRRLGGAGRQRVQQEFSLTLNIDRLEAAFRSAIREKSEIDHETVLLAQ